MGERDIVAFDVIEADCDAFEEYVEIAVSLFVVEGVGVCVGVSVAVSVVVVVGVSVTVSVVVVVGVSVAVSVTVDVILIPESDGITFEYPGLAQP